jgi:photosystem II stability/assembly factor-like uncharacterized protein
VGLGTEFVGPDKAEAWHRTALWRTDDGGQSWAWRGTDPELRLVDLRDAPATWRLEAGPLFTHSVDGGRTWQAVAGVTLTDDVDTRYSRIDRHVVRHGKGRLSLVEKVCPIGEVFRHCYERNRWFSSDAGAQWAKTMASGEPLASGTWWKLRAFTNSGFLWFYDGVDIWQDGSFSTQAYGKVIAAGSLGDRLWVLTGGHYSGDALSPGIWLWRSSDGGRSWLHSEPTGLPASLGSNLYGPPKTKISLADSDQGWMSLEGRLYHTLDGGNHWALVQPRTEALSDQMFDLVGGRTTLVQTTRSGSYHSYDAGVSWSDRAPATAAHADLLEASIRADALWLDYVSGDGQAHRVYRSIDGGAHWQRVLGAAPEAPSGALQAVWIFESLKGLALGKNGLLLASDDGGMTWRQAATLTGGEPWVPAARLQFVGDRLGWALVSAQGLSRSVDGGQSWSLVEPAGVKALGQTLTDFHFIDAQHGWLLATNGVLGSSDGGLIWRPLGGLPLDAATVRWAMALHFSSATVGVVVGEGGRIARSTDGGASWAAVDSGVGQHLNRVRFVDATRGWAVGAHGTVLRTTDSGVSWQPVPVPTSADLNDLGFADARRGWIVGSGGIVMATNDGGQTWSVQATGQFGAWWGVRALDAYSVWLVGDYGSVLVTATGGR